ncbi:FAD-binding protein [Cyanobium sp. WAJ14-Wanaka]|uniref:FAD-binding protein n=1 Tax=Cyanobium sp. WAJ14-Wanaka TaxID=2823725 RepID=UPI0020CC42F0|nr:FAD-binding protein [Cyanobium sp. WAJ14-Wanaka]MCP9774252.1 hypothetical protein [Cyanobium sp. WAJ14-Wanaka]
MSRSPCWFRALELPDVVVVGGGLAGGLLALALAEAGQRVVVVDADKAAATGLSYGGVVGDAVAGWQRLQQRHGDLGLSSCRIHRYGIHCHGIHRHGNPPPEPATGGGRVDGPVFRSRLPQALADAGVGLLRGEVRGPLSAPGPGAPWRLCLGADSPPLAARKVVLAAGAHCRTLWPALPDRLRSSWAGVLQLEQEPSLASANSLGKTAQLGRGDLLIPQRFARLDLEARAAELTEAAWVVDPGLAPWGSGSLLGQISWVPPGLAAGVELADSPDPAVMETHLRAGVAALDPALAQLPGNFQQLPVAFCIGSEPLVGPVADAPGLWAFSGFSGAFSQVPLLVGQMAMAVASW